MKKIAIFDLDGTLLYTLNDLKTAVNYALSQFNYSPKTIETIRKSVGNGVEKLIERVVPEGKNNQNFSQILDTFKNYYKENMYNETYPYDGIIDLLKNLHNKNVKIAVVSNKFDSAVKELCNKYFANLVDYSCGENEILGIKKKPSPDTVLKVLSEFKIKKENAVFIGDSEVDIQTAKNAQIDCISVTWGYKTKEFLVDNGAKIIVNCAKDLENYI